MAIQNNIAISNIPIKSGHVSQIKKNENTPLVSDVSSISEESESNSFSLVLSSQQEQAINDTLGYDQPSAKDRGAIDAYRQVAVQEQREQIMNSMSFHFVV